MLALLLAILLTAPIATPATPPAATPPPVAATWQHMHRVQSPPSQWTLAGRGGHWLYGDSITAPNATRVARALHALTGRHTAVDAHPGIPTKPAVDRLAARVKQRGAPRTLIMATGANDTLAKARIRGLPAQIARVRAIVGPRTRIIWVTALVNRPRYLRHDKAATRQVNTIIHQARARGVINDVAPWAGVLTGAGVQAHTRHGVHPVGRGITLWVRTVAAAVIR